MSRPSKRKRALARTHFEIKITGYSDAAGNFYLRRDASNEEGCTIADECLEFLTTELGFDYTEVFHG
jgi:hypothetical protein